MKKDKLNQYVGKRVKVKLIHENEFLEGILKRTEDQKNDPNMYLVPGHYFVDESEKSERSNLIFSAYSVSSIKEE